MIENNDINILDISSLTEEEQLLVKGTGAKRLFSFKNKPYNIYYYTRYSSPKKNDKRKDEQATTEDQIFSCDEFAKYNYGVTAPTEQIINDFATSGALKKRPGYLKLVEIIEQTEPGFDSPVSHLLIRDNARVFRGPEIENLVYKCAIRNIKIIDVLYKIDLTDESRLLEKKVLFFISEINRLNHSMWARNSIRNRATKGYVTSGKIYGFDHEQLGKYKKYVINKEEIKIIKKIYNWYGFGGRTAGEIADTLTAAGFPTPGGQKRHPWHSSTVTSILDNLKYRGIFVYGRDRQNVKGGRKVSIKGDLNDVVIVQHPSLNLIPDDLWNAVREKRAKSKNRQYCRNGNRKKVPNIVTGTFRCAFCKENNIERALQQKSRATNPKYKCPYPNCPSNNPAHQVRLWFTKEIGINILKMGLRELCTNHSIKNIQQYFNAFKKDVLRQLGDTGRIRQEIRDLKKEINGFDKLVGKHHSHIYPATMADIEEKRKLRTALENELEESIRIREKIKDILNIKPKCIKDLFYNFDQLAEYNESELRVTLENIIGQIYVKPVFNETGIITGIEGYTENSHLNLLRFFDHFHIPCQQIQSGSGRQVKILGKRCIDSQM